MLCLDDSEQLGLYLVQVALMGQAEAFRAAGEAPGVEGLDKLYPGMHFTICSLLTGLMREAASL